MQNEFIDTSISIEYSLKERMMNRLLKDGVIIIMKDQVTSRNTQRRSYGRFHVSSILRSNNGFRQLFIRNRIHYDLTKCIYKRDWTEATSPHTNSAPLFYCSFILHILTFNRSTQNLAVSSQQQKAFIRIVASSASTLLFV